MVCICGNKDCNGLCETSKGMRLALLMKKAGTLQTHIGEEALPDREGNKYRYCGIVLHMKDGDGRVCKTSDKYKHRKVTEFTSSPLVTLKAFKDSGVKGMDEIIEKAKNILNNDEVFYPIKVGNSVEYLDDSGSVKEGKISKITIALNDDGDMKYKLHIVGKFDNVNYFVTDYCQRFWLSNIETANVKDEKTGRIINMTETGFISPICFKYAEELKDKKNAKVNNIYTQVIVDNTSVYLRSGGNTREIARLGNLAKGEGLEDLEKTINEPKLYKAIKSNLQYMLSHQLWVAPLGFAEEFEVEIK